VWDRKRFKSPISAMRSNATCLALRKRVFGNDSNYPRRGGGDNPPPTNPMNELLHLYYSLAAALVFWAAIAISVLMKHK